METGHRSQKENDVQNERYDMWKNDFMYWRMIDKVIVLGGFASSGPKGWENRERLGVKEVFVGGEKVGSLFYRMSYQPRRCMTFPANHKKNTNNCYIRIVSDFIRPKNGSHLMNAVSRLLRLRLETSYITSMNQCKNQTKMFHTDIYQHGKKTWYISFIYT